MKSLLITNARLVRPGVDVAAGSLLAVEGRIAQINPGVDEIPADAERIDEKEALLTPGLIDVHTHGIEYYLYETPDGVRQAAECLGKFGVTCVLPGCVPKPGPGMVGRLRELTAAMESVTTVRMPGFHHEGPFMGLPGAACPTVPGNVDLVDDIIAACNGRVSVMSISPEVENAVPVIDRLLKHGVVPFVTHTAASVEQTQAAIDAGARHATHFFDVFPVPKEYEPGVRPVGVVETFLADPRATVDFICDGCHVHPIAVKMALAAKGWQGVTLITDSNIGAGLPAGVYDTPWGYPVRVKPDDGARIAGDVPNVGLLAGSALTMNVGIANLLDWLDLPPEQVWAMGSLNPANLIRMPGLGRIEVGAEADLVLWNDDLTARKTWVGGRCIYEAG